jgi:hypothetical protein
VLDAVRAALTAHRHLECIVISSGEEPTFHPGFAAIVDGLVRIRDMRAPTMKLAVVSPGPAVHSQALRPALSRLDMYLTRVDADDAVVSETSYPSDIARLQVANALSHRHAGRAAALVDAPSG